MKHKVFLLVVFIVISFVSCIENPKPKMVNKQIRNAIVIGNKRPIYDPDVLVKRDTVFVYEKDSIFLPECPSSERKYSYWYTDGKMNENMLYEACDFNMAYTRKFAADIAARYPGNFSIEQACEIYTYCMTRWGYVNDPYGQEYVASASETICANLRGDCDDFAVLISSLMMAVGGNARIVTVPGHAYAELDVTDLGSENEILNKVKKHSSEFVSRIYVTRDHDRVWLSMDWGEGKKHIGQNYTIKSNMFDLYMYSNRSWHWKQIYK